MHAFFWSEAKRKWKTGENTGQSDQQICNWKWTLISADTSANCEIIFSVLHFDTRMLFENSEKLDYKVVLIDLDSIVILETWNLGLQRWYT